MVVQRGVTDRAAARRLMTRWWQAGRRRRRLCRPGPL